MAVLLGALFYFWGAANVWLLWCVPVKPPGFADLRDVLGGIQLARAGAQNTADTFGLVGGYPGIWALLGWLGLGVRDTVWAAIALFCAYAASLYVFARRYSSLTAVVMAAIIFSPAAMLGYERANLDLAMFAILSVALWLAATSSVLPVGLIVLAAMLKIYPILGLGYLLKQPRGRFLLWAGIGLGVFIIYTLAVGARAMQGMAYIPKGDDFDYGAGVIAFHVLLSGVSRLQSNLVILFSFLVLYLIVVAALFLSYRLARHARLVLYESPYMDAFRLGAIIYVGTFIQGNSFNYRLIFLVFCIPQMVIWTRRQSPVYWEARGTLVAVLASCWAAILLRILPEGPAFMMDEFANWILFSGLLYLLIVSLPDWLFIEIERFFKRYERAPRSLTPSPEP
jgi:hypothetical protein